jgi:pyridinium-3,5-biscarboxylic acid mononucleotide synthase
MNEVQLRSLMAEVAAGAISPDAAIQRLKHLPYEDVGFAKVDHHRQIRRGVPETIFGQGKTAEQIGQLVERYKAHGSNVLATRVAPEVAEAVLAEHPDLEYNVLARTLTLKLHEAPPPKGYIAVVCAGTTDLPVAEEAAVTCEMMGNLVQRVRDVGVAGLHRLLNHRAEIQDANVAIVCAGMEGALPSVIAGLIDKPVIAVPTSVGYGASFNGLSALLTMLNSCAEGVSVVNIDNGFGAAITASLINRLANAEGA